MKRSYYIYNNGTLRRKDNTLTFIDESEEQKNLPIEQINDIYVISHQFLYALSLRYLFSQIFHSIHIRPHVFAPAVIVA